MNQPPDLHQQEIDQAMAALGHLEQHQDQVTDALALWSKRLRFSLELYQEAGDKHPATAAACVRRSLAKYTDIVKSAG